MQQKIRPWQAPAQFPLGCCEAARRAALSCKESNRRARLTGMLKHTVDFLEPFETVHPARHPPFAVKRVDQGESAQRSEASHSYGR